MNVIMINWRSLCYISILVFFLQPNVYAEQQLTLNVHSNTPPFEWQSETGEENGFNIELARYIAQQLHYDLHINRRSLDQTLNTVTNDTRQLAVIAVPSGEILDINKALPLLPTYISAYNRRGEENADTWAALKGKRVAIKSASSVAMYLNNKPQDFIIIPVITNERGFELLSSGEVDYVVSEFYCSRRMLSLFPIAKTAGRPLLYSQFYLIMSDKDPDFVAAINEVVKNSFNNGYFDDLLNQWVAFGKEKIELGQVKKDFSQVALVTAIISSLGMLITLYISFILRKKTKSLKQELLNRRNAELEIKRISVQFHSVLDGLPHGVCLIAKNQQLIWQNGKYPWILEHEVLAQSKPKINLNQLIYRTFTDEYSQNLEFTLNNKHWKLELHLISNDMLALFLEDNTETFELKQASDLSARLASLGELSAGIAHEINNPVGLITQSVTLVRDLLDELKLNISNNITSTQKTNQLLADIDYGCESIDDSAGRISRIVRDLKHFSKPILEIAPKAVYLNNVVETALRLTHNNVKRIHLQLMLNKQLPTIEGDELQLQLVLVNLIQNACFAMDKPEPLLVIETGIENSNIFIKVTDNGCGMDTQTLERIREPFFTTRRDLGGTGLGLSTSNKILSIHQAQWLIHSQQGTGTEMKILFRSVS
ncbi:transporter substrate-binding domain-containing protein [Shewanella sp. MEBiC00475]|uniref:ATP-binding protein n=1 Tax=Shewanella sp. MEBiC00475 TaxID=2575361 RepID=UPI0010C0DA3C|nr:transporter substrate-binding domain-containing protein [Shewanella sp. MEBiC00475]